MDGDAAGAGAPAAAAQAPVSLDQLRRLCRGAGGGVPAPAAHLPLGAPLDGVLGGGLARGMLHEALNADPGGLGALLGFGAAIAARLDGPVVWVRQDMAVREAGGLYGAGCAEMGLDPGRLLLVEAADAAGVLRAAEEALRHPSPALVIAETWGTPRVLDLTATRRLALRAGERGALVLLLRPGGVPAPSAAATRWLVGPAASRSEAAQGLMPQSAVLQGLTPQDAGAQDAGAQSAAPRDAGFQGEGASRGRPQDLRPQDLRPQDLRPQDLKSQGAVPQGAVPQGGASLWLGPAALALELVRNRLGPTGRWIVEWDADARYFKPFGALPAPHGAVPAAPAHRPAAPVWQGDDARRRA